MGITQNEYDVLMGNAKNKRKAVYQHKRGEMTGSERRYEDVYLKPALVAGMIRGYVYEGETLILAKRTAYTPDFVVLRNDGTKEYHEIKGSGPVREASRVRFKIAAKYHPDCLFVWARERRKKDGGGFAVKEYTV